MVLTPENKAQIDAMPFIELLRLWRFAPVGDPWFQGETGKYWGERMAQLRSYDPAGAAFASKAIGLKSHGC